VLPSGAKLGEVVGRVIWGSCTAHPGARLPSIIHIASPKFSGNPGVDPASLCGLHRRRA